MEKDTLKKIHFEWESDDGALAKFRGGEFDETAFRRLLNALKEVDFADDEKISHDLVSIIWDIPYFYENLVGVNLQENDDKARNIKDMRTEIYNEVSRIFYFRNSYMPD